MRIYPHELLELEGIYKGISLRLQMQKTEGAYLGLPLLALKNPMVLLWRKVFR